MNPSQLSSNQTVLSKHARGIVMHATLSCRAGRGDFTTRWTTSIEPAHQAHQSDDWDSAEQPNGF
jgi:hypothetical protein